MAALSTIALVGSAIVGAGVAIHGAEQQAGAARDAKRAQEAAANESRRLAQEQEATTAREAAEAAARQRDEQARRFGRGQTTLTGPTGLADQAPVKKTVLGG